MLDRLGGMLILAAIAALGIAVLFGLTGDAMSVPGRSPGGLAAAAALISLGLGLAALGIAGRSPLDGRVIRGALITTGLGLVLVSLAAPATMDSVWVYALIVGGALAWLGAIATLIALLARGGRPRRIGALAVGGIVAAAVGQALLVDNGGGAPAPAPIGWLVIAVGLAALIVALLGLAAIGLGRIPSGPAPVPATTDPT